MRSSNSIIKRRQAAGSYQPFLVLVDLTQDDPTIADLPELEDGRPEYMMPVACLTEDMEPEPEPEPDPLALAAIQAETLLADARHQAVQIREEARVAGFNQGMTEAEARWVHAIEDLKQQQRQIERDRDQMLANAEMELVSLAVEIARRVIHTEVRTHPDTVVSIARTALERVRGQDVRLTVHPDDLDVVRASEPELSAVLGAETLKVTVDDVIDRGGCIIEAPSGRIDATLETQLAQVGHALLPPQDNDAPWS